MRRFHGRKAVVPTRGLADGEVEKMYFHRLLGFVYREVMKGSQKGFVPKRCANCERWFLQMQGINLCLLRRIGAGAGWPDLSGDRSRQHFPQQDAEQ